ncbi:DUF2390 domain-containing protein, partial [Litorivivens sp.]
WAPDQIADMVAHSQSFRENFLLEARALRRRIKQAAPPNVYQEAQRFEMSLERWQQDEIYSYWQKAAISPKKQSFPLCAQTNLHRYFDQLELAWNGLLGELIEAVAATPPAEGDA